MQSCGLHGLPFFPSIRLGRCWDFRTFDWISGPAYVDNKEVLPHQTLASVLNSIDPRLERFRARGGKLIQYHGFSDPEVALAQEGRLGTDLLARICFFRQVAEVVQQKHGHES